MSELDNYSQYPKSVGEARSDKTNNSKDWSPRDLLLYTLRELDAGNTKPIKMALVSIEIDESEEGEGPFELYDVWWAGGFSRAERLGLAEIIKKDL
jgi:hypothetical protein